MFKYKYYMATEDFKLLTYELFDNYVKLRKRIEEKGYSNVSLSFREYLDFYIQYEKQGLYYEEEDSSEEDDE